MITSHAEHSPEAPDDWLAGCIGFAVDSSAGRIGRVVEVQRDAESRQARALVLRSGIGGRRRRIVAVDDIAAILPSSGRIVVTSSSADSDVRTSPAWAH